MFGKALLSLAALIIAPQAHAAVISGTSAAGTFAELSTTTPFSVGFDNFNRNILYAFDEKQDVLLGSNLTPDFGGTLIAGTTYSSHYVFFDPARQSRMDGTVTFDADIVAVFSSLGALDRSDAAFGSSKVTYLAPSMRGLEPADSYSVAGRTISVSLRANTPGDYLRVVTLGSAAAVPEPGSWALMLAGLAAVGMALRGQQRLYKAFI